MNYKKGDKVWVRYRTINGERKVPGEVMEVNEEIVTIQYLLFGEHRMRAVNTKNSDGGSISKRDELKS